MVNNTEQTVNPQGISEQGGTSVEFNAGGLPSAQLEMEEVLGKFQLNDEFVEKNFKNGKLYGRFDSLEGLLNTLHDVETKYSNVMRDIKSNPKTDGSENNTQSADGQTVDVYAATAHVIEKYIASDFDYTAIEADAVAIAEQYKLTPAEVKLAALEMREQLTKAYSLVGGKAEYQAMIDWGMQNLPKEQQAQFDKAIKQGMGEFAIEGLYNRFKAATSGNTPPPQRISGDSSSNQGALRPYSSFQELAADRQYIQSARGRSDSAARKLHEARLSITPENVIYSR